MTFTPFDKQLLQKSTADLQQTFNGFAKLYFPPNYKKLRELISQLEDKYIEAVKNKAKDSWRFTTPVPDQTRLDQIGCLTQLMTNLPEKFGNDAELQQAHRVLLGAVLYRYLRIESSYTDAYGLFGSADNSALKVVLFVLLGLSENNRLDSQTIVTCCGEYCEHLKQNGNSDRYSYIKKDMDFFINIEKIINTAKISAAPIASKMQYIIFVQSVSALLSKQEEVIIKDVCQPLCVLFEKKLQGQTLLESKDVRLCLRSLNVQPLVSNFFEERCIMDDLEISKESLNDFSDDITGKMSIMYQYSLLGAYIMCIEQCKPSSLSEPPSPICAALQFSIGVKAGNSLDNKCRYLALYALKQMIELSPEAQLHCDVWGGPDLFKAELIRQLDTVQNLREEAETKRTSVALK